MNRVVRRNEMDISNNMVALGCIVCKGKERRDEIAPEATLEVRP